MKIVHLCLSCFYIDDRSYQENELVNEHARQGHEVFVLASTHTHGEDGKRGFSSPCRYRNKQGVEVIRLPYHHWLPHSLAKSLRVHKDVYAFLEEFSPDVIMFHGMCGWELVTVAKYKKNNPKVKFFVDTHTDFINSAKSFISKWFLHYLYYRPIIKWCLPYVEKVLFISTLTGEFARDFYNIPSKKLEFYPLGGHPISDDEYQDIRNKVRHDLDIPEEAVVFIQSGKQSHQKKIIETLQAFISNDNPHFLLYIVGSLLNDVGIEAKLLIDSDERIQFLGWKSPNELRDLLCAADVYVQPGSQSSTMQTSLCCYCVPILSDIEGHDMYTKNNGWLVNDTKDIEAILHEISSASVDLDSMKQESKKLAREKLDYALLAQRILR